MIRSDEDELTLTSHTEWDPIYNNVEVFQRTHSLFYILYGYNDFSCISKFNIWFRHQPSSIRHNVSYNSPALYDFHDFEFSPKVRDNHLRWQNPTFVNCFTFYMNHTPYAIHHLLSLSLNAVKMESHAKTKSWPLFQMDSFGAMIKFHIDW